MTPHFLPALPPVTEEDLALRALRHAECPFGKRAFDLVFGSLALAISLPILLPLMLLVFLQDGGSPFFVQVRVGAGGRRFKMLKLRSMARDAEARRARVVQAMGNGDLRFKARSDPRITRLGRILRRFSLDELPQLLNVVRGDMSIVGPRPPIPEEVARYKREEWGRLAVRPGLTCLWQVRGRAEIPFQEQVQLDLAYVQRRGPALDLRILMLTLPAVLGGRGAW